MIKSIKPALISLGLISMLNLCHFQGLAKDIKKEQADKKISLEIKPVIGKISNYSGNSKLNIIILNEILSAFEIKDVFLVKEEVMGVNGLDISIKQGLFKQRDAICYWDKYKLEKKTNENMEDILNINADKDNISVYNAIKLLPNKPVGLFEQWERDININFSIASNSLFKYSLGLENKHLELILTELNKRNDKETAKIVFYMIDDIKDYQNEDISIDYGSFYIFGDMKIENMKKELVDFNCEAGYFFNGKVNDKPVLLKINIATTLKNDKYR